MLSAQNIQSTVSSSDLQAEFHFQMFCRFHLDLSTVNPWHIVCYITLYNSRGETVLREKKKQEIRDKDL